MDKKRKSKSEFRVDLIEYAEFDNYARFLYTAKAYFPNLAIVDGQNCIRKNKKHQGTSDDVQSEDTRTGTWEERTEVNQQTDSVATNSQATSTVESRDDDCQTVNPDTVDQCWQTDSPVSVGQMCESIDTTQNSTQDPEGREDKDLQTDKRSEHKAAGTQADLVLPEHSVPSHWIKLDTKDSLHVLKIDIKEHTNEYKEIKQLFTKSITSGSKHFEIKSFQLQRIQNRHLWDEFCWRKQQLQRQRQKRLETTKESRDLEERRFFHGTTEDTVPLIIEQGFDMRMNGKNMTKYGRGTYFAKEAWYSHGYTQKKGLWTSTAQMFVARVLIGDYNVGNEFTVRPDWDDELEKFNELCVDSLDKPFIFVIFNNDQTYPEYLITYTF